jgi:hypothetical protein
MRKGMVPNAPRTPISVEVAFSVIAAIQGIASPENCTPNTEKVSADHILK